jgi:hypothetical protein
MIRVKPMDATAALSECPQRVGCGHKCCAVSRSAQRPVPTSTGLDALLQSGVEDPDQPRLFANPRETGTFPRYSKPRPQDQGFKTFSERGGEAPQSISFAGTPLCHGMHPNDPDAARTSGPNRHRCPNMAPRVHTRAAAQRAAPTDRHRRCRLADGPQWLPPSALARSGVTRAGSCLAPPTPCCHPLRP